MSVKEKLTAIADPLRELVGRSDTLTLDEMAAAAAQARDDVAAALQAVADRGVAVPDAAGSGGLAEKIAEIPEGVELPVLSNPATWDQVFQGYECYDQQGNIWSGAFIPDYVVLPGAPGVLPTAQVNDSADSLLMATSLDIFGDAEESDVAAGKSFTSKNGVALTGTAESGGGTGKTYTVTITAPSGGGDVMYNETTLYLEGSETATITVEGPQTIVIGDYALSAYNWDVSGCVGFTVVAYGEGQNWHILNVSGDEATGSAVPM